MNKPVASLVLMLLICTLFFAISPSALAEESFSQEQKQEESAKLRAEIEESKTNSSINQGWDITFKIGLLVIALVALGGSGYAATFDKTITPGWLKAANIFATGAIAALSTFSSTQLDFSKRQAVWRERAIQLESCEDALKYLNPNKEDFLRQTKTIITYGDKTVLTDMKASCIQEKRTGTAPGSAPSSPSPAASR